MKFIEPSDTTETNDTFAKSPSPPQFIRLHTNFFTLIYKNNIKFPNIDFAGIIILTYEIFIKTKLKLLSLISLIEEEFATLRNLFFMNRIPLKRAERRF